VELLVDNQVEHTVQVVDETILHCCDSTSPTEHTHTHTHDDSMYRASIALRGNKYRTKVLPTLQRKRSPAISRLRFRHTLTDIWRVKNCVIIIIIGLRKLLIREKYCCDQMPMNCGPSNQNWWKVRKAEFTCRTISSHVI